MERKENMDLQGAALLIFISVLLGLNQVMVKVTNDGLQPVFQAGLRSLIALAFIIAWTAYRRKPVSISDGSLGFGLASGAIFAVEFIMLFWALDLISVARVSLLFYTMPVWLAIPAHFILPNERMTMRRAGGMALAVLGVAVAMSGRGIGGMSLVGDLLALGGAMCWAAIALTVRATPLIRSSPEMQLLYQLTVSSVILLAAAPWFGPLVREFEMFHAGLLGFQAVMIAGVAFLLWFWILTVYPATKVASFGFLAPVLGVFFGWLLLGEEIGPRIVGALALVSLGIYFINKPVGR